jgi:hypothetical protein
MTIIPQVVTVLLNHAPVLPSLGSKLEPSHDHGWHRQQRDYEEATGSPVKTWVDQPSEESQNYGNGPYGSVDRIRIGSILRCLIDLVNDATDYQKEAYTND